MWLREESYDPAVKEGRVMFMHASEGKSCEFNEKYEWTDKVLCRVNLLSIYLNCASSVIPDILSSWCCLCRVKTNTLQSR